MPITIKLTEGQAHDGRSAADMLDNLQPGQILLADRAYDSNALREAMTAQGAWANIRPMDHRLDPPAFSPFLYRYRNLVERFFNKLKHYRGSRSSSSAIRLRPHRSGQAAFPHPALPGSHPHRPLVASMDE